MLQHVHVHVHVCHMSTCTCTCTCTFVEMVTAFGDPVVTARARTQDSRTLPLHMYMWFMWFKCVCLL